MALRAVVDPNGYIRVEEHEPTWQEQVGALLCLVLVLWLVRRPKEDS
jgi:hypothetical protein